VLIALKSVTLNNASDYRANALGLGFWVRWSYALLSVTPQKWLKLCNEIGVSSNEAAIGNEM